MNTWNEQAAQMPEPGSNVWKPEPGESRAGRVTSISSGKGKQGNSTLASFTEQDGAPFSVWLNTVLLDEFEKQQISVGDVVAIKYFGIKTGESGRDYKCFGVSVLERASRQHDDDIPF